MKKILREFLPQEKKEKNIYAINLTTILSNKTCILKRERESCKTHQEKKSYFLADFWQTFH